MQNHGCQGSCKDNSGQYGVINIFSMKCPLQLNSRHKNALKQFKFRHLTKYQRQCNKRRTCSEAMASKTSLFVYFEGRSLENF